jgi:hypothetical protein
VFNCGLGPFQALSSILGRFVTVYSRVTEPRPLGSGIESLLLPVLYHRHDALRHAAFPRPLLYQSGLYWSRHVGPILTFLGVATSAYKNSPSPCPACTDARSPEYIQSEPELQRSLDQVSSINHSAGYTFLTHAPSRWRCAKYQSLQTWMDKKKLRLR